MKSHKGTIETMIKLADNLALPLEVLTQTIGLLAKRLLGEEFDAGQGDESSVVHGCSCSFTWPDPAVG